MLLLPGLALLFGVFLAPLGITLRYSFNRFVPGGLQEPAFVLDNYVRFILDPYYAAVLLRTLAIGAGVALVALLLGYPLAYAVARSRSRWRALLIAATLIPLMTSVVVRSYGWTILLSNSGVINGALASLGLPRVKLLYTMTGVVLSLTQVMMPFLVLTLVGVLQNISRDLEDAARGLGAGRWRVFRDILLPLSLPGIAAGSFLVFALTISAFATPRLVGGASVEVMATMIYDQVLSALNWPFASATSIILLAIVLVLTIVEGRMLRTRSAA
ncbi:MAG: ABC transporter permease [Acidisphaera sp.]|nr:ABC transporter permease [Acidisphaera sp.]